MTETEFGREMVSMRDPAPVTNRSKCPSWELREERIEVHRPIQNANDDHLPPVYAEKDEVIALDTATKTQILIAREDRINPVQVTQLKRSVAQFADERDRVFWLVSSYVIGDMDSGRPRPLQ